ncbi:MAG: DUF3307 domain-containing protein [Candidatus Symbiothrix sp.]|jgi:hypothetical protein|nr:DUF3307 domain-containing protein [Candidatus Symbiothrix sp.]
MYYTLLFLQFAAHLLADFNCQPHQWCDAKDRKLFSKEVFYHTLVVLGFSWAFACFAWPFLWASLAIALFHLGLDIVKSYFIRKNSLEKYLFFIDQALHFAFITFVVMLYCRSYLPFQPYCVPPPQCAFILFALIACTKPANIFIKKFMEANFIFPIDEKSPQENATLMNAGRVIGFLERILSLILILVGQWAAIGFIIAAKTILRFRETNTAKTEYVLIGSLLSFGIAILLGITYSKL